MYVLVDGKNLVRLISDAEFNALDEAERTSNRWLPIEDQGPPSFDSSTHTLTVTTNIFDDRVVVSYEVKETVSPVEQQFDVLLDTLVKKGVLDVVDLPPTKKDSRDDQSTQQGRLR